MCLTPIMFSVFFVSKLTGLHWEPIWLDLGFPIHYIVMSLGGPDCKGSERTTMTYIELNHLFQVKIDWMIQKQVEECSWTKPA